MTPFKGYVILNTTAVFSKQMTPICAHKWGGCSSLCRHFGLSFSQAAKVAPRPKPREKVEIPGLEMITFGERMHFVPGLAKPVFPPWSADFKDPMHYRSPPATEMPLYKEKPCHVFNQRCNILEGVDQALWLTKTQLIPGLPPSLLSSAQNPVNQIPNLDDRVLTAIKHARFWDTTQDRPDKFKYSHTLLYNLLYLCQSLQSSHPAIGRRIISEQYNMCTFWRRGDDLLQVRGRNGVLLNSMDPLPQVAGKEDVSSTVDHVLKTFYPVSPTIDLQQIHVYNEEENYTGFKAGYSYPHAHTLFFEEPLSRGGIQKANPLRAKMIMFAFGNALARARIRYGADPQHVLDEPITVQAVGTNGRIFHFVVFQLNTTDLYNDDGVKNQVWVDGDAELYEFAKVCPLIKKKQIKVPAGVSGYNHETFIKFLALYLHGAV